MIRPLLLLVPIVAAMTAEVPLGIPRLNLWRDGAALVWTVALTPGEHTAVLPAERFGVVAVRGATWHLEERTETAPAEPLPPAWEALRAARNRWAADRLRWTATGAAHQAQDRRLLRALPGTVDPIAAQAAIDAWLGEDALRAARDSELVARYGDLARQAQDLLGQRSRDEDLLALDQVQQHPVLTAEELAAAWARRPRPEIRSRVLHLAGTGPAVVSLDLPDLTWTPAATLVVSGTSAALHRQARIVKPADLDLGTVPVTVSTSSRRPALAAPEPRPVALRLRDLHPQEGRTVAVGTRTAEAETAPVRLLSVDAPAMEVAKGREEAVAEGPVTPAGLPEGPVTSTGLAETWDLGPLALGAGVTLATADRPAAPVTVVGDLVALWPGAGPIPVRRLGIRLDDRPLQAGPLTLVVEGTVIATQDQPLAPPGSLQWWQAGEDRAIFAEDPQVWDLKDEVISPRRRVSGTITRLHNLGTTPRAVTVVRTLPVARSEGLAIIHHPRTTPGGTTLEPGLWSWTLTIPPGGTQDFAEGWIATSDHLDL